MNFPTLSEYNQSIAKYNGAILNTLKDFQFIPSRTIPFKMFQYGAGTFAGVFKAKNNNINYAIRCFITSEEETLNRYKSISNYLNSIDTDWQVDFEFIEYEINIENKNYPILKMEWIDGLLINEFVSSNLNNQSKITLLQEQLVQLSNSLEKNNIGHGDLQSGNIIIQEIGSKIRLRLIDYDGMFVPELNSKLNIEKGRPEFQHPQRNRYHYNSKIDRFSIWVMVTALEAIKYDPKLWNEIHLGGYNTGDNFLFIAKDFIEINNSQLFDRLSNLKVGSLTFYLQKLKFFCKNDFGFIEKPELSIIATSKKVPNTQTQSEASTIDILSDMRADVYNSVWVKLGATPLNLPKAEYIDKIIYIQNKSDYKKFIISEHDFSIKANFIKSPFAEVPIKGSNKEKNYVPPKITTKQTPPQQDNYKNFGWAILLILGLALFFNYCSNNIIAPKQSDANNSEAVDSTAIFVDSAAAVVDSATSINEFGAGNGKLSIWNYHGNGGKITIKMNGDYVGEINQYYSNNTIPDCINNGSSIFIKPVGQYTIQANDESGNIWRKLIDINEGKCSIFRIDLNSRELLSESTEVDPVSAPTIEENEIVSKCKLFLESLGESNCKYAFKQTFIPEWEAKGENWFCSSKGYGGVNIVSDIKLSFISKNNNTAKVEAKYYANDKFNGPGWYDQIFELQRFDDNSWLIIKITNN